MLRIHKSIYNSEKNNYISKDIGFEGISFRRGVFETQSIQSAIISYRSGWGFICGRKSRPRGQGVPGEDGRDGIRHEIRLQLHAQVSRLSSSAPQGAGIRNSCESYLHTIIEGYRVYAELRMRERCFLLTAGDVFRDFEDARIYQSKEDVDYVVVGDAGNGFTYDRLKWL
jgi:hypothetical protein